MTTPVNPMPATRYVAVPANPPPYGLLSVAEIHEVTGPSRHLGGVMIRKTNCSDASELGGWDSNICARPEIVTEPGPGVEGELKRLGEGERTWTEPFPPMTIWTTSSCDPSEPESDLIAQSEHKLRLHESMILAGAFAESVLYGPESIDLGDSDDIVTAVGKIEMSVAGGMPLGVIYASPGLAAHLQSKGLIIRSGASLKTPMGHTWCFDYFLTRPGSEVTLFYSGTPQVWRDAVTTRTAVDVQGGEHVRMALSERTYVMGTECYVFRTKVPSLNPNP